MVQVALSSVTSLLGLLSLVLDDQAALEQLRAQQRAAQGRGAGAAGGLVRARAVGRARGLLGDVWPLLAGMAMPSGRQLGGAIGLYVPNYMPGLRRSPTARCCVGHAVMRNHNTPVWRCLQAGRVDAMQLAEGAAAAGDQQENAGVCVCVCGGGEVVKRERAGKQGGKEGGTGERREGRGKGRREGIRAGA